MYSVAKSLGRMDSLGNDWQTVCPFEPIVGAGPLQLSCLVSLLPKDALADKLHGLNKGHWTLGLAKQDSEISARIRE